MNRTDIEWTDYSWNPVTGCSKVSEGCQNCYAEAYAKRFWGRRKFTNIRYHPERLDEPEKLKKPSKIFVCSMSDLFHEDIPELFIRLVFQAMGRAPWHTFIILTKRPQRMCELLTGFNDEMDFFYDAWRSDNGNTNMDHLPNVWLGTSIENQPTANKRILWLRMTPAAVRFVSVEPMLNNIKILGFASSTWGKIPPNIDWVICGGESGPNARPMHPFWVNDLLKQCQEAEIPFFFKQWGEWALKAAGFSSNDFGVLAPDGTWFPQSTGWNGRPIDPDTGEAWMVKVGRAAAGCLIDGVEWKQFPEIKK